MAPSTPSKKRARLSGVENACDDSADDQSPRPITQRKTSKAEGQGKSSDAQIDHRKTQSNELAATFQQTKIPEQDSAADDYFCEKCSALDFERIFSSRTSTKILRPIDVGEHSNIVSGLDHQCVFCKLLWDQIGLGAKALAEGSGRLILIASFEDQKISLEISDANGKAWNGLTRNLVPETGTLHLLNPPDKAHRVRHVNLIHPNKLDFVLVRDWLRICQTHYRCQEDHIPKKPLQMRMINCETREIEEADGTEPYVALSYVWGTSEPSKDESRNRVVSPKAASSTIEDVSLPTRLPLTIEDAILATRALNIKHLWVDRHCISGTDEKKKILQIKQMDQIYHQAEVTLVAAAGRDPSFGLPGVFFACQESTCSETTHMLHGKKFSGDPNSKKRARLSEPEEILGCIAEFSRRKLTFESDALNAVLGVLRRFEVAKDIPTYHLWGVPILPPLVHSNQGTADHIRTSWTDGFLAGLCWYADNKIGTKRRFGFPTWSWAGWTCSVSPYSPYYKGKFTPISDQAVSVLIGGYDDSQMHFEQFLGTVVDNVDQPIRDLYLEGLTIDISARCFEMKDKVLSNNSEVLAYPTALGDGRQFHARLYPLCLNEEGSELRWSLDNQKLIGIFLGKVELYHIPHSESQTCESDALSDNGFGDTGCISTDIRHNMGERLEEAFVMVLKEVDGAYQRVGHIALSSKTKWLVDYSTNVATKIFEPMQTLQPYWTRSLARSLGRGEQLKAFEETEHLKPWLESARIRRLRLK
ncbi:MAG: hypothetical protein Q9160_005974 [Pyrenula sp. 1 TL-2023]